MSNEVVVSGTMVGEPFTGPGVVSQLSNGEWSVSGSVPWGLSVNNLGGINGGTYGINIYLFSSPVTYSLDGHVYNADMGMLSGAYVTATTPGVHSGRFDADIVLTSLPGDEFISTVGAGTVSATWAYVPQFGQQVLSVVGPITYTFKNVPEPSTLALFAVGLLICVVCCRIRGRLRTTSQMACAGLPRCTA